MARLDFEIKPEGGTLVSFDFEYNDYLQDIGCVDPKKAKEQAVKSKRLESRSKEDLVKSLPSNELDIEDMDDVNGEAD
jgi:hypothetical protein